MLEEVLEKNTLALESQAVAMAALAKAFERCAALIERRAAAAESTEKSPAVSAAPHSGDPDAAAGAFNADSAPSTPKETPTVSGEKTEEKTAEPEETENVSQAEQAEEMEKAASGAAAAESGDVPPPDVMTSVCERTLKLSKASENYRCQLRDLVHSLGVRKISDLRGAALQQFVDRLTVLEHEAGAL
jgi:hypothetical protein